MRRIRRAGKRAISAMLVVMFAMTSVPVESLASEPVRESASSSSTEEAASYEAEDSSEEVVSEEDSSYEEVSSDNLSSEEPVSEEVTALEEVTAHEEASSRKVSYVENQYENGYVPAVPETYTNVQSCGDYEYVVRDGGAVVTGYVGSDEVIVIPSEMDEYPVTAIGDRAFYEKTFGKITVPSGVTSIGVESFSNCTWTGYDDESNYYDNGPFTVYLPEGLTDIGERAFENTDIFEIQIPSTILHIGKDAFVCNIYELQFAEGTKKIPDYALYGNVRIDHMNFPKSLEEIGVYAFYGCTG
ncbi:MAG: leucine-rich repeat domain-containing protein, partial [Lachnospiraceae bacterium]|nr:leucine-rich repeat domain-containing protein [Lachnospiraceae bacterium]